MALFSFNVDFDFADMLHRWYMRYMFITSRRKHLTATKTNL